MSFVNIIFAIVFAVAVVVVVVVVVVVAFVIMRPSTNKNWPLLFCRGEMRKSVD